MDRAEAVKHWSLLCIAVGDLYRHRSRSLVVTLCLATILFPFVTAMSISEGLRFQAELSVKEGADIYVSADQCGGTVSLDANAAQQLARLPGVSRATARVVGRTYMVDRVVTLVGVEKGSLSLLEPIVHGRVPEAPGEVLVGHGIARNFGMQSGMPFTLAANNRKVFRVSGILEPSCLWGSDLIVMHYEDANEFFRTKGRATQLLIYTSSDTATVVAAIAEHQVKQALLGPAPLCIEERRTALERLRSGYGRSQGIFSVLFIVGAALTIPALVITCGLGQAELRREMGVMKAIGWKTQDLLEKVALENVTVSVAAVCVSVLLCMVWMKGLNGIFLAQFFVAEVGMVPEMAIPSRVIPSHLLLALAFVLVVTQLGGLISVWRSVHLSPKESMR